MVVQVRRSRKALHDESRTIETFGLSQLLRASVNAVVDPFLVAARMAAHQQAYAPIQAPQLSGPSCCGVIRHILLDKIGRTISPSLSHPIACLSRFEVNF